MPRILFCREGKLPAAREKSELKSEALDLSPHTYGILFWKTVEKDGKSNLFLLWLIFITGVIFIIILKGLNKK